MSVYSTGGLPHTLTLSEGRDVESNTMTINIELSPEQERFVRRKLATGRYADESDVIHEAIRRLQADEGLQAAWQAALKIGDDQLDRGDSVVYSRSERDEITRVAEASMFSSRKIDPDVLP